MREVANITISFFFVINFLTEISVGCFCIKKKDVIVFASTRKYYHLPFSYNKWKIFLFVLFIEDKRRHFAFFHETGVGQGHFFCCIWKTNYFSPNTRTFFYYPYFFLSLHCATKYGTCNLIHIINNRHEITSI